MAKFGAIRFFAEKASQPGWSATTNAAFATGASVLLGVDADIDEQLQWLLEERPAYLLTSPSNLCALVRHSQAKRERPAELRQVLTYAEVLPTGLRDLVRNAWGVPVADTYSSTEAGAIALQCPEHAHYHVQSESVYVEVLRDDGAPCAPGEVGRVIVTPLHNFAMPLLRYDIGDYAEVGDPCACGRGLSVLRRIVGRARNMARDPTGRHFQPGFDQALADTGLPVAQFQFVQQTLETIEMSYVMDRDVDVVEMDRFRAAVKQRLPYPFEILFRRVAAIPRSAGGKYEGFISLVD